MARGLKVPEHGEQKEERRWRSMSRERQRACLDL